MRATHDTEFLAWTRRKPKATGSKANSNMEYAHKHTRDTRESTTERGREIIIGDIEIEEAKKLKKKKKKQISINVK